MLDNILNALDKVKKRGRDNYTACCPVHNDRNPSMSIREASNGDVLIFCHACGAKGSDVVKALGLSEGELFAGELKRKNTGKPHYPRGQCKEFDKNMIDMYERQSSKLYSDFKKYRECKCRVDNFNSRMKEWMLQYEDA